MTYAELAQRSGVSQPTVVRALSGRQSHTSFANVVAIAQALGLDVTFKSRIAVHDLMEKQAEQKARRLAGMVQGTSGLEGQALDDDALREMTQRTVYELLAGSPRRLWSP